MWEWFRRKLGILKRITDATEDEINGILEGFSMREDLRISKAHESFDFISGNGVVVRMRKHDSGTFAVAVLDEEMCLLVASDLPLENISPQMERLYDSATGDYMEEQHQKMLWDEVERKVERKRWVSRIVRRVQDNGE